MQRTGPALPASRRKRAIRPLLFALGAALLAPPAIAAPGRSEVATEAEAGEVGKLIERHAGSGLRDFYARRRGRPLWLDAYGNFSPAAETLLDQIETARLDGINPRRLKARALVRALDRAGSGNLRDLAEAELALSRAYVAYVQALRAARRATMIYESEALAPVVPAAAAALDSAASAPSLAAHVARMNWMHPLYAPMRAALADPRYTPAQHGRIAINLERIRALPANPGTRHVLIDAASARLWMYENGKPVDSMRVVVGRAGEQTPAMAGFLRHAIVNPYWNVPADLVRDRIAAHVQDKGIRYLRDGGYQVLSDWHEDARPVDPRLIDWDAVRAGTMEPRVRQLPGGDNAMGSVKFMFPNALGIYLHDTPDKGLMRMDARQFSSGCVRLEDANRLGRWLMGKPLPRRPRAPEQRIDLPEPVPVYITYLTAAPESGGIAFREDVYARDSMVGRTRMARTEMPPHAR
jgi:murein L,D-transpeptidase YcbB/YkuD